MTDEIIDLENSSPDGSNNQTHKREELNSFAEFVLDLIMVVLVVFVLRTFVIAPYAVSGESMENTIHNGELLIADRLSLLDVFGFKIGDIRRGDIVILSPPDNPEKYFIKRVVGLPGETIYFQGGEVFIKNKEYPEGAKLVEPYLSPENQGQTLIPGSSKNKSFDIPHESYFVMGDNRLKSSDSRRCFSVCTGDSTPFLPKENIISRAWFSFWPIFDFRFLENGSDAYQN